MIHLIRRFSLFVVWLSCAAWAAAAPPNQGAIAGVVVEPGGAPSPKARITLFRRLSGDVREIQADDRGKYSAANLLPGDYSVTAVSALSAAAAVESVILRGGATTELRLTLGAAPQSGGEFPIENRDYLSLVRAKSEMTAGQEGGNIEGFGPYGLRGNQTLNSYGARGQENNYLLDGIDNNTPWVRGTAIPAALEATGGMRVFAGYIPPEFGHAAGAVVSASSRAASPRIHGSAYEFGRTSAANARNFFDGAATPAATRNQYGAALGVPVLSERWTFGFDVEAIAQRQGQTVTSTVPTKAEKNGVFPTANVIYDPTTIRSAGTDIFLRSPYPANTVPQNAILAPVRSLLALYPDPSGPGLVNNYSYVTSGILNRAGFNARTDYDLSPQSRLFARYSAGSIDRNAPGALPMPTGIGAPAGAFGGSDVAQNTDAVNAHEVWRGGAVSIIFGAPLGGQNEFRAGYNSTNLEANAAGGGWNASSALKIPGLSASGMPSFNVPGYASLGAAGAAPFTLRQTSYQVEDAITGKLGRHSWKAGVQAIRRQLDGDASDWSARAAFLFSPDYTSQPGAWRTGDAFASFLIGFPSEVRRNIQFNPYQLRAWEFGAYAEDTFRYWNRLQVQVGLRYSVYPPLTEQNNHLVNFNFSRTAPALDQFAAQGGVNQSGGLGYRTTSVAPRIGFQFDFTGRGTTVLRANFTQSADAGSYIALGSLARNPPYAARLDMVNGTFQLGSNLTAGLPAAASISLTSAALLNAVRGSINAIEPASYTPYSDQWSLGLETRVYGVKLEATGMGSMGMHLLAFQDINQPYPAPTPYAYKRYPHEPYHSRVEYTGFAGGSTYYSGTFRISSAPKPVARIQAAYTFAKALDDASAPGSDQQSRPALPQYTYDLRGSRSPSSFDVTQRFVATATFSSPVKFAASPLQAVAADWRLLTIANVQTGLPFTPELAVNSLNNGGVQLPDRVAIGDLPADQQSYLHWFNTSLNPSDPNHAFQYPALYQYGNSAFNILRGPGMVSLDAALARDIAYHTYGRFQIRIEAYNLLNQVNFALPNRVLGVVSSGAINHTATPSRRLQFGIRFDW